MPETTQDFAPVARPSILDRLGKAAADPGLARAWLYARLFPARGIERNIALSRRAGLRKPCFVLSFDCDTDLDSAVAPALHARLRASGLSPLYAVAGEVLEAGAASYRDICRDGAVFLNHGFRRHAAHDTATGAVTSTYFYNGDNVDDWQRDIRLGHDAVGDILGRQPDGFRTPHFASFERPQDLSRLWALLTEMKYRHSSSTRPLFALRHGPFFRRSGVVEFPVSGCISQPEQILDSWGIVRNGGGTPDRLLSELRAYRKHMETGQPVFLNIYMDPADIADQDEIIETLGSFAPFSVPDFATVLSEAGHA